VAERTFLRCVSRRKWSVRCALRPSVTFAARPILFGRACFAIFGLAGRFRLAKSPDSGRHRKLILIPRAI
jgi:hypothetical protein